MMGNAAAIRAGAVDHDRDGGHVPAQLEDPVAVRRVVAVEPPDPAERGRAAHPGGAKPPDEGTVQRLASVLGRFGTEHRELAPERHAVFVGARQRIGRAEELSVALADLDPFHGGQRAAEQCAEFGQHLRDAGAGAHRHDHHGHLGVAAEEPGPFPAAVGRAVHAEQCGGPVNAAAVQQVADRDEGGDPVDPLLAPEVHGELARPGRVPGQVAGHGQGRLGASPASPLSSRARSRVTSPVRLSSSVGPSTVSMRERLSTAIAVSGRSSERVSDRSVRR